MSDDTDDRCNHGTEDTKLCSKCERNPDCHWNEGGYSECWCEP